SQVDIRDTQALGSNSLLWKVITRFQVISGNHQVVSVTTNSLFVSAEELHISAELIIFTLLWDE
ncbi:hypothetical protein, partial [Salmonella enterica]|uniref:hypothetical protein n=1 Tax=Salmonella enterica TaxID=28901 RepID=UPI0020C452E8